MPVEAYLGRLAVRVSYAEPLRQLNTLALEATASAFTRVHSEAQLCGACHWAAEQSMAVVPLGQGSNIVLRGDIDALVVAQCERGRELLEDNGETLLLRVAAGESWHELVLWTLEAGYNGLENLALIPGTVGAAPIQNIGAYGVELDQFVEAVHCIEIATGDALILSAAECKFAYRESIFKHAFKDQLFVTAIDIRLSRSANVHTQYPALSAYLDDNPPVLMSPQAVCDAVIAIRSSKLPDPALLPNVGSFFKNPLVSSAQLAQLLARFPHIPHYAHADGQTKIPAAWLIDYCGWKGRRCDGVGVHPDHALVLVNYGANNGEQLLALARDIADSVAHSFGLQLDIEPRVYG